MSFPTVYDELSERCDRAAPVVRSMLQALPAFVRHVSFSRSMDDQFPLVEAWVAPDALMTAQSAVQLGDALQAVTSGPVDFFRIRPHSAAFLVHDPALAWPYEVPNEMRRRCVGVPFTSWREAFLARA